MSAGTYGRSSPKPCSSSDAAGESFSPSSALDDSSSTTAPSMTNPHSRQLRASPTARRPHSLHARPQAQPRPRPRFPNRFKPPPLHIRAFAQPGRICAPHGIMRPGTRDVRP